MTHQANTNFLPILPEDEFLHPPPEGRHYTSIETSYFGFHLPEFAIEGEIYVWFHTALDIMGVMLYFNRGHKRQQLEAEYLNHHDFLPMVKNNDDYRVQMGGCSFAVKVEAPLQRIRFKISDPDAGFGLEMLSEAAAPPIGRPGGKHLTQLMRNSGSLMLRGEIFPVSGHFVRDRSWGQLRGESPQPGPPACWMTGIFGDDLAFHLSLLDTSLIDFPEYGPHWLDHVDVAKVLGSLKWESGGPTDHINLRGGWWFDGQRTRKIVTASKRTTMAADEVNTLACELEIVDDTGERHLLQGESLTTLPKMYGQNLVVYLNQTRWTYGGRIGVGILETVYCNEHLYKLAARRERRS